MAGEGDGDATGARDGTGDGIGLAEGTGDGAGWPDGTGDGIGLAEGTGDGTSWPDGTADGAGWPDGTGDGTSWPDGTADGVGLAEGKRELADSVRPAPWADVAASATPTAPPMIVTVAGKPISNMREREKLIISSNRVPTDAGNVCTARMYDRLHERAKTPEPDRQEPTDTHA